MHLPYFVFTSGEEGVSRLDWGVKFSSPSFFSLPDPTVRNLEVDKAYRKVCQEFSCALGLKRPNEGAGPGFLVLPWQGSDTLVGFVFPYADRNGRPNISLVGVVVPRAQRASLELNTFIRALSRQNPLEKIARRGWGGGGQGERPLFLLLNESPLSAEQHEEYSLDQRGSWAESFLISGGEKKVFLRVLVRPQEPAPPLGGVKMKSFAFGMLLVGLLAVGGVFLVRGMWQSSWLSDVPSGSDPGTPQGRPLPPSAAPTPSPVPRNEIQEFVEELSGDIAEIVKRGDQDGVIFENLVLARVKEGNKISDLDFVESPAPFEANKPVVLEMPPENDVVFLNHKEAEEHMEGHVFDSAKKLLAKGGSFTPKKTGFVLEGISEDVLDAFEKSIKKIDLTFEKKEREPLAQNFVDKTQELFRRNLGKSNDLLWIVLVFRNSRHGAYDVHLKSVRNSPWKMEPGEATRLFRSPGGVKISTRKLKNFIYSVFNAPEHPSVKIDRSNSEITFYTSQDMSKNAPQDEFFKQFAREVAEKSLRDAMEDD